jgi:methyl-accepting chemotaxis protein
VLISAVESFRIVVTNEIVNPEERGNTKLLDAARDRVNANRAAYEPLITRGTEDAELIRAFDEQWKALREGTDKILAQAATDQSGALTLLYGPSRVIYRSAVEILDKEMQFNKAEGRKAADRGAEVYHATRTIIFSALGAALLLAALLGTLLVRAIAQPVQAMTAAMTRLADGELDIDIPGGSRKDELGRMAATLLVFRDNARKARALQQEADQVRVQKERRQAAMDHHTQNFGTTISGVMGSLGNAAGEMRTTANDMAGQIRRIRDTALGTAEGATASSQNMAAVAAGAEEMAASINEISKQVAHVTTAVHTAIERAVTTDSKVASMAEAAERVGHVVQLITNIAGQTNLLALNATIEAARAGEAGKGFAVVAGEVKALAAQTAKATDEISAQIGAIRTTTEEAVGAMREVTNAISQVEQVATAIAAAVEEQAAATQEIASSVQKVTLTSEEAARAMQDVSGIAGQADESGKRVLTTAGLLGDTARTLRGEVDQFLAAMTSDKEEDRRQDERVLGAGTKARLSVSGQPDTEVTIENVSRGGVVLATTIAGRVGDEMQITLRDAGGPVTARVTRVGNGTLALCFPQDAATLSRIDRVLDRLGGTRAKAA